MKIWILELQRYFYAHIVNKDTKLDAGGYGNEICPKCRNIQSIIFETEKLTSFSMWILMKTETF